MHIPDSPEAAASKIISRSGYAVVHRPDPERNHLAHTLGLCLHPGRDHELAVTGQDARTSGVVLNGTVEALIRARLDPAEDMVLSLLGQVPVRFRRVVDASRVIGSGGPLAVWQVLLPDRDGAYPDEPSYRQAFIQPLL
ncbi:DUF4262 domain-containing protein [Streptomyces californicus]|uniref:DUF4262 domain-containing protein n=1 Tax=Streptomyces californicus TaxID=67351 RepID=UPI00296E5190|nr:DUF4262 domain-containing protein [Streptomyces californicus]MDW4912610.1 DUF4262 domain-containing protein [Streptomyces californicus]